MELSNDKRKYEITPIIYGIMQYINYIANFRIKANILAMFFFLSCNGEGIINVLHTRIIQYSLVEELVSLSVEI